jgi:LacI family transcriptional regulator
MLATRKSYLIGLIVADIGNPFYAELARGIETESFDKGYRIVFCSTENRPERMQAYVERMVDAGVEGIILASARLIEPIIDELLQDRFPVILVNRKTSKTNCNFVVVNNTKGAYDMTQYLMDCGYTRIAFVSGPDSLSTGNERLNGFRKAFRERGVKLRDEYIVKGPFIRDTGYIGARSLLQLKPKPDAIFAGNDYIAMGVIDAIDEVGLKIPEDIAVVGFDDTAFAANRRINLTTVSQRQFEMGGLGVKILIDDIEGKGKRAHHQIVLEPHIVIRQSCRMIQETVV